MMKIAAIATLLAGSASAFSPAASNGRLSTAVAAEKSQALPFMNRPPLVSRTNSLLLGPNCQFRPFLGYVGFDRPGRKAEE